VTPAAARWLVLAAAVLFSTGGAAIKTGAFSAAQVSMCRSGVAALVLLAFIRGRFTVSGITLGAAALYAVTLTLFVAATKLTTAANAIFLQSVAPLYLLIFGPVFLREKWSSRDLAQVGALALGLVLCVAGQGSPTLSAPDPATGNMYAAVSGLTWAGTLLFLRRLGRNSRDEHDGLAAVIAGNALACLVAIPSAWPLPVAPATAWASVLYLGVFQIGLAYVCLTRAIRHVSALEASLLLLIEPVLNPIWTWLVHGETPGPATLLGGAIILTATAVRAMRSSS
jgi:drug/metabolite transporter, DME family